MIGIGTDLVDVDRFRRSLDRTPGLRERLFRPDERAYSEQARDPAARFAARFAAKEATLKALGLGLGTMALYDIEVVREPSGRPTPASVAVRAAEPWRHRVGLPDCSRTTSMS